MESKSKTCRIDELAPRWTERAFICGKTGCGKTTLAEQICKRFDYVVALDAKRRLGFCNQAKCKCGNLAHRVAWLEYKRVVTFADVLRAHREGFRKIIYAPLALEQNAEDFNRFFKWVFLSRNWAVYVDEFNLIGRGDSVPFYYKACYMQGRELGITTITSTQRPIFVAGFIKSEAEHAFVFKLRLEQDQGAVEKTFGISEQAQARLRKHEFFYMAEDADAIRGPLILDSRRV